LQQYIFAKNVAVKKFEDSILKGAGKVVTYTIMTVPPAGFEDYTPYAWVVMELGDYDLRISGFLANIQKPEDLPIGAAVKVVDFDNRGIVLEKL